MIDIIISVQTEAILFFAFVTGLVLGSVAALMASRDTREKVKETFDEVKQKGQKMLADTTRKAQEGVERVGDEARELADRAENAAKNGQKQAPRRQSRT